MTTRQALYLPVIIATAVLLVCAVALLAGSQKAEATFRGQNGKIAYASYDGQDYEIYTINPGGSGRSQVTHNVTNDVEPSYSPDGHKITYAGYDGQDYEIYTINAGGGISYKSRTTIRTTSLLPTRPAARSALTSATLGSTPTSARSACAEGASSTSPKTIRTTSIPTTRPTATGSPIRAPTTKSIR